MRIVTPPNASRAVFITEAPSVTEELFTTALPTPPGDSRLVRSGHLEEPKQASQKMRTGVDLVNDFLRRLFVEIVYYDVRAARAVEDGIPGEMLFDRRSRRERNVKLTLFRDRHQHQ
jgi:hypothetical protein